jgi:DNA-binding IclR family transcriptional regulator
MAVRNESDEPLGGRGVLDGAFRLLKALPAADRDRQIAHLSELTGIPRPSVYRLMAQLQEVGAVERAHGRYVPGQALTDVVARAEPVTGLRQQARDVMNAVRIRTGATVSLAIAADRGCRVLEVIPGIETLPTAIHAGVVLPRTAAAALVFDPSPAPDLVGPAGSWASDDAHNLAELTCFASPIRVGGRIEAVLQISTPASRPSRQFASLLHQATDRITTRLITSGARI